ncbi:MAG: U32 family peptidase [Lachnospiraceae bacterium]|jgi:putative protease|nr:U32 family peptidase [Lachnospiraceae bacterium]
MSNLKGNKIELLAPAGTYLSLLAAVNAGADAIYAGGTKFGARAFAGNLTEDEILRGLDYLHLRNKKLYLTINTLLKEAEMNELYSFLLPFYRNGLDAVIVQDLGVLCFIKDNFPDIDIHASTQMGIAHAYGADFLKESGVKRIIPARELLLPELKKMKRDSELEIECFIHGAMCYCYSGQCLFSSFLGGRSGNRGQCAGTCRLAYSCGKIKEKDLLSMKDLNGIFLLPEIAGAGVDSLKIEGRMKPPSYVHTVVSIYRKYIDLLFENERKGLKAADYKVDKKDLESLESAYRRRGYHEGYFHNHNDAGMISLSRPQPEDHPENDTEITRKTKIAIAGKAIIETGKQAQIIISFPNENKNKEWKTKGAKVAGAINHALDSDTVRKQLNKLGDTDFEWESLDIILSDDAFMGVKDLNELRRNAITDFRETLLYKYKREVVTADITVREHDAKVSCNESGALRLTVLVSNINQLRTTLDFNNEKGCLSAVYVESDFGLEEETLSCIGEYVSNIRNEQSPKLIIAMPHVFRDDAVRFIDDSYDKIIEHYDGILVRGIDSLGYFIQKRYEGLIVGDAGLYAFNEKSKNFWLKNGCKTLTAPLELNRHELQKLGLKDMELVVYGHIALMISANCLKKTTKGCDKKDGLCSLTDRRNEKFTVKNSCKYCYNVIYNCVPLNLAKEKAEINRLMPSGLRLQFTIETPANTRAMLDIFCRVFCEEEQYAIPDSPHTGGHFNRGVK